MTAKSQTKRASKLAQQSTPMIAKAIGVKATPEQYRAIDRASKACASAHRTSLKAGANEACALGTWLKTVIFADPECVMYARQKIEKDYGPDGAAGAAICVTALNNARAIECGGTKDKHHVAGRGRAILEEVLARDLPLRDLKKALCDAKPEGLKHASTGSKKPKAPPAPEKKAGPVNVFEFPAAKPAAFETLLKVLDFATSVCDAGHDAAIVEAIHALESALRTAEISRLIPRATRKAA